MLHLLWVIIKVIGLLLAAVLAILLFLLLCVLFVPVRYRARGSYEGKPEGYVKITWFLHILSIKAVYHERLNLTVRVFGVRFFPRKGKIRAEEVQEEVETYPEIESEEILSMQELGGQTASLPPPAEPEQKAAEQKKRGDQEKSNRREQVSFFHLAKRRITVWFRRMKAKIRSLGRWLKRMRGRWDQAVTFLSDERNQAVAKLVWRRSKKLVCHLLPTKISGNLTFGTDDPGLTGQILAVGGILYPCYGKRLKLQPVFDRPMLEGQLFLKGRVRLAVLVYQVSRVYFDRDFRRLWKKWMRE